MDFVVHPDYDASSNHETRIAALESGGGGGGGIEVVSYTGNGKTGSTKPTTINFSTAPSYILLIGTSCSYNSTLAFSGSILLYDLKDSSENDSGFPNIFIDMSKFSTSYTQFTIPYYLDPNGGFRYTTKPYIKKSSNGKTIYIYTEGSGNNYRFQYNIPNITYYWAGIS